MHFVAPLLQQLNAAHAGNTGQHSAHGGCGIDFAVYLEHNVHGANFLYILALHAVQPQYLSKAQLVCLFGGDNGGSVVAAALDITGAAGCGAHILVLYINVHRIQTLFIVSAGGGADDDELILAGGLYAQYRLSGDGKGTNVQTGVRLRGYPVLLHFYQSADRFYKVLHRDFRNAQTVMGRGQARTVFVRAEQLYLALGGSVCLQTLKALLCIVEHQCGGIQYQRLIGDNAGVMPALALVIIHDEHMVRKDMAEAQSAGGFFFRCFGQLILDFQCTYLLFNMDFYLS